MTSARTSRPSYNDGTTRTADLDHRIAGILEGVGDDPITPRAIREIDRLRAAALAVIEADLPATDEARLLERLLQVAKSCELPWLAAGAVLEEIRPDATRPADPRRYSIRARQLRRAGYVKCPCCALDVLDESTLQRLEADEDEWAREHVRVAERRERLRGVA
jgi:hypothetical protein